MRYQTYLDIGESNDLGTFRQRLVEFGAELGFGLVSASILAAPRAFAMIHNAPDGFAESATRNGEDAARDPVLQRLKKYSVPFVYDQTVYVNAGAGDLWEEQAPYGYKTGIAVSVHLPGSKRFLLGFDRDDPLPTRDADLTRMLADLQFVAVHAQEAAARLLQPPEPDVPESPQTGVPVESPKPRVTLSPRQLEVLQWAALGKTLGETGQILEISPRTAKAHLHAALQALDCGSTAMAIYRATQMGLL